MTDVKLDHIAFGLPRAQDAVELFESRLGGVPAGGYDGEPYGFRQWEFAGGGRLEVIYPSATPGGFVQRFLANGGPRVHHVTLKVPSLDRTIARAAELGYDVVGVNRSDPHWQEAFLHPKQAQGIVVQMVEQKPRTGGEDWPVPRPRSDAARVLGLRLAARSADDARRQWVDLLGGSGFIQGDALIFRWPGSPLVLWADVRPDQEPGPLSIEVSAAQQLELPDSVYPGLGTRFAQAP